MFRFKNTPESYTTLFLCMFWGAPLMTYIKAILIRIVGDNISSLVVPLLFIIVFLLSWKHFSKQLSKGGLFFYVTCSVIYLFTYAFYPNNSPYLDDCVVPFLFSALPLVFVGRVVNIEKHAKPFYFISILCIVTTIINVFLFESKERAVKDYNYDMLAAYTMLPHILMVIWHLLQKTNIIDSFICIIGLCLLLGYGTRGPILCVVVFIALYLVLFTFSQNKLWLNLITIASVVILFKYMDSLIILVNMGLERENLSLRIISQYEIGELANDTGRLEIQSTILNSLSTKGVLGLGLCGDRVLTGTYSHNLIIELWASFGYIFGTAVFVALFFYFFYTWRHSAKIEKEFLLMLISYLTHLFISGSFLDSQILFFTIGFCSRLLYKWRMQQVSLCR